MLVQLWRQIKQIEHFSERSKLVVRFVSIERFPCNQHGVQHDLHLEDDAVQLAEAFAAIMAATAGLRPGGMPWGGRFFFCEPAHACPLLAVFFFSRTKF